MTLPNSQGTGYLGFRGASQVTLDPNNKVTPGAWVALFNADDLPPEDFEVYHIALKGPAGGFEVYIDDRFYSTHDRSDRNEYDPNSAMFVRRGQSISFHFKSSASPTPTVNIDLRQPKEGIF